jgi:hypothetical protein
MNAHSGLENRLVYFADGATLKQRIKGTELRGGIGIHQTALYLIVGKGRNVDIGLCIKFAVKVPPHGLVSFQIKADDVGIQGKAIHAAAA